MRRFERNLMCLAALIAICLLDSTMHAEEPLTRTGDRFAQLRNRPNTRGRFRRRTRSEKSDLSKLKTMTWKVGETTRKALVSFPSTAQQSPPLVFVFHGHGGTGAYAARKIAVHELWPEAICVYPHGLPTAVPFIDPEGKWSGWQKSIGDQEDRDLEFFDQILKTMRNEQHIDENRIYSVGHSNGGFFTYVLWAARGDQLAAVVPIAALNGLRDQHLQKPKPVMHLAGEKDRIVPFQFQLGTIERLRKLNGCDAEGEKLDEFRTAYTSATGPPVIAYLHPGGHEVPADAPRLIVKFLQEQTLK